MILSVFHLVAAAPGCVLRVSAVKFPAREFFAACEQFFQAPNCKWCSPAGTAIPSLSVLSVKSVVSTAVFRGTWKEQFNLAKHAKRRK